MVPGWADEGGVVKLHNAYLLIFIALVVVLVVVALWPMVAGLVDVEALLSETTEAAS